MKNLETHQVDITVIIPIYNSEKTLRKCLDSLVSQTLTRVEFLCIDDGSTDNSPNILAEYQQRDSRFRVITKANGGVSTARNMGLDCAQGRFVMFLDSDDWYEPYTCETALSLVDDAVVDIALFCMEMEYVGKTDYRAILSGSVQHFDADGCADLHRRCLGLLNDELADLLKFDYLSLVYLKIFRRDLIEREHIRFHDIREIGSFEDGLFSLQFLAHSRSAVYSPQALYHYNKVNQSSITTKYRENLSKQWKVLFSVLREHIRPFHDEKLVSALNSRIAHAILGLGLNIVSSNEKPSCKKRKITEILNCAELHQAYTWGERRKMPFPFAVFFTFSAWRWTQGVYFMLILMSTLRNKSKGIKQ